MLCWCEINTHSVSDSWHCVHSTKHRRVYEYFTLGSHQLGFYVHRMVSCFDMKEERGGTGREKGRGRNGGGGREGKRKEERGREGREGKEEWSFLHNNSGTQRFTDGPFCQLS